MKTFDDVVDFHGHSCPGLALGYRVALRALSEFKDRSSDEEIVAIVENDSCAVDAIQVILGCTFGKGNLIFSDYGKQVYTFFSRPSGKSVRISIDWKKPKETSKEKAFWDRYIKGDRKKEVLDFIHNRKSAKTRQILKADESALMRVTKKREKIPDEAAIYSSIVCSVCREKVMESRARIRNAKIVCIPCFDRTGLTR
jgi:formylmethanofuran dehydrogenase subunit E